MPRRWKETRKCHMGAVKKGRPGNKHLKIERPPSNYRGDTLKSLIMAFVRDFRTRSYERCSEYRFSENGH